MKVQLLAFRCLIQGLVKHDYKHTACAYIGD